MASGVEFEEDSFGQNRPAAGPSSAEQVPNSFGNMAGGLSYVPTNSRYGAANQARGGMAGWLIRHRLAKTPEAAQKVMIGIVVFNLIVTFVVIKFVLF